MLWVLVLWWCWLSQPLCCCNNNSDNKHHILVCSNQRHCGLFMQTAKLIQSVYADSSSRWYGCSCHDDADPDSLSCFCALLCVGPHCHSSWLTHVAAAFRPGRHCLRPYSGELNSLLHLFTSVTITLIVLMVLMCFRSIQTLMIACKQGKSNLGWPAVLLWSGYGSCIKQETQDEMAQVAGHPAALQKTGSKLTLDSPKWLRSWSGMNWFSLFNKTFLFCK